MLIYFFLSMALVACSSEFSSKQTKAIISKESIKIEISMEEAIALGAEEASNYYRNLKLTEVHSYDNDYVPDMNAGIEGKREWWYVDFANKENNYVSILIRNGTVIDVKNANESWNNGLLDMANIKLTSKEAVEKAKALGLRGGNPDIAEEWVRGYNFKLSYASLIRSPDDIKPFFEVIGISPNGNFAHIDFDAETGELLLAEEKIVYDDGSIEWKNFHQYIFSLKCFINAAIKLCSAFGKSMS